MGSSVLLFPKSAAIHECPDCGLFNRLACPTTGVNMVCARCGTTLRHTHADSLSLTMSCCFVALLLYVLAVTTPYLQTWLYGSFEASSLITGPLILDNQGYWGLAAAVMLFTIIMPLTHIGGLLLVLIELRRKHPPRWIVPLFSCVQRFSTWSMIEVYLLGLLVAYTRLQTIMQVHIDVGSFALFGLMMAICGIDTGFDPQTVWETIERKSDLHPTIVNKNGTPIGCDTCHKVDWVESPQCCSRCGAPLRHRKPQSLQRTCAFALTAALLYIPSNYFPVMTVTNLGHPQSYTIFAGLRELATMGMWPLAALVFVASMVIPLFKLAVLVYLLVATQNPTSYTLRRRTRLYRMIDLIGRWSMVDIFMVSILVALVHFGAFTRITAEPGATYFAAVVILTMLAAQSFDPRLMWDKICRQQSIEELSEEAAV